MPTKKQLIANISEERILQLSNDISEDIKSGTLSEWRAVAVYFRSLFDKERRDIYRIRCSIAAYVCGQKIIHHSTQELDGWLTEKTTQERKDKRK